MFQARGPFAACLRFIAAWLAILLLGATGVPAAETRGDALLAFGARIAGDDARSRVVIDFDGKPSFSVHYLAAPERIVIDLPATAFGFPADDLAPRGLFQDIRYGAMDEGSARIVFTPNRPVKLVNAEVQKNEGHGFRLVLDAEMSTAEAVAELVKTQSWTSAEPTSDPTAGVGASAASPDPATDAVFTIAVDAGHGGIDTGTVGGKSGTPEKEITLAFARDLTDRLNREPGVRAFLTRKNDTFLSLSQRVTLARQGAADLFISLHADQLGQKGIRGATVYTLSDTASDRMAAALAARENLSDQLAGYAIENGPPEIADILLDLARRETQAFSISLARRLVNSFNGQIELINNPHRSAGFQVLRAPDIPSILLELGFLSNEEDEKLLLEPGWRSKVADLIAKAVTAYRQQTVVGGG
ncbi:N-acetylmuramoyl-L-alanine amidase [Rhizobium sp. 0TCS1.26]|uniref:N-acetylmuramoyl-L-alanine amidase n=1 Tax=Rhizobium sp. 0TCS1.26 TaxID=3142623 RepID=UPI003D2B0D4F